VLWASLGWLLGSSALFYGLWSKRYRLTADHIPGGPLVVVVAVAAVARLVPAVALGVGAGYDIESFTRVAQAFWQGTGVYGSELVSGRHPYLPLQLYWIAVAWRLSELTHLPFVFVVKLAPILADVGMTALIFVSILRDTRDRTRAFRISLMYALNPVSLLVSAYHGQFDTETLVLLGLAWYWSTAQPGPWREALAATAFGLAILNKSWPALLLPLFLWRSVSWRRAMQFAFIAVGVPIVFTLLYTLRFPSDLKPMLARALTHAGVAGWWGISAILGALRSSWPEAGNAIEWLGAWGRWLALAGVVLAFFVTIRRSLLEGIVTSILAFYAFTSGFGLQWVLWVVPFALLLEDLQGVGLYVGAALIYMVPAYWGYHLDPGLMQVLTPRIMFSLLRVCALPVWAVVVWWLVRRMRYGPPGLDFGGRVQVTEG